MLAEERALVRRPRLSWSLSGLRHCFRRAGVGPVALADALAAFPMASRGCCTPLRHWRHANCRACKACAVCDSVIAKLSIVIGCFFAAVTDLDRRCLEIT